MNNSLRLHLHAEPVPATGAMMSEGFQLLLSRAGGLHPLSVLIRETVQNSWDARQEVDGGIGLRIEGWEATLKQRLVLRDLVFADSGNWPGLSPLRAVLDDPEPLHLLSITDTGTTGLTGPVRANALPREGERRNFANLFLNMGAAKGVSGGGGRFGFGKSIMWAVSRVHAVCGYTAALGEPDSRRFIASAMTQGGYSIPEGPHRGMFTGRHWWGRRHDSDGHAFIAPVTGTSADEYAAQTGLHPFEEGTYGTSFLIVAPQLYGLTFQQFMDRIRDEVMLWWWPRMVADADGTVDIGLSVMYQGFPMERKTPEQHPQVQHFVNAWKRLPSKATTSFHTPAALALRHEPSEVRVTIARRRVGDLSMVSTPWAGSISHESLLDQDDSAFAQAAPVIGDRCHHVAIMRSPGMVVRYLQQSPPAEDLVQYAGVFVASDDMNDMFALAEPPEHDTWIPTDNLPPKDQQLVRLTMEKWIPDLYRRFTQPITSQEATQSTPASAIAFAATLGRQIPGLMGNHAGTPKPDDEDDDAGGDGGSGGSRRLSRPRVYGRQQRLTTFANRRAVEVQFSVEAVQGSHGSIVNVELVPIIDGGKSENQPPVGAHRSTIVAIQPAAAIAFGSEFIAPADQRLPWMVTMSMPEDVQFRIQVTAQDMRQVP